MNVNVHIERLILDGIDLPRRDRAALKASVSAELGRLLADGGLSPAVRAGGAVRSLPAGGIQLAAQSEPTHLGQQIARAVYGGLGT
jgi:hypothetical protein